MTKLTHSDMSPKPRLRHGSGFFLKLRLLAKKKRSAHRTSKKIRQTDKRAGQKAKYPKTGSKTLEEEEEEEGIMDTGATHQGRADNHCGGKHTRTENTELKTQENVTST